MSRKCFYLRNIPTAILTADTYSCHISTNARTLLIYGTHIYYIVYDVTLGTTAVIKRKYPLNIYNIVKYVRVRLDQWVQWKWMKQKRGKKPKKSKKRNWKERVGDGARKQWMMTMAEIELI